MKDTRLTNASGTTFDMNIDRTVSLMDAGEVAADFNIQLAVRFNAGINNCLMVNVDFLSQSKHMADSQRSIEVIAHSFHKCFTQLDQSLL